MIRTVTAEVMGSSPVVPVINLQKIKFYGNLHRYRFRSTVRDGNRARGNAWAVARHARAAENLTMATERQSKRPVFPSGTLSGVSATISSWLMQRKRAVAFADSGRYRRRVGERSLSLSRT